MITILDIPNNTPPEKLITITNDRLRRLAAQINMVSSATNSSSSGAPSTAIIRPVRP